MSALKREILYRGKQKGSGDWVEGVPVQHSDGDWQIQGGYSDAGWRVTVIPETVCQYTGLTDKNGRKIFEHDIVRQYYTSGGERMISEIIYNDSPLGAGWKINDIRALVYYERSLLCTGFGSTESECVEVIGNIFDDPELLEGAL